MNRDDISEQDVRNNKVKEGFLTKRSRILKDWKKRWMVLTKTHLYAFEHQGVYKAPLEKIPLKEITTIKSFYKNQYERPQVFRVESEDTYFYLSAQDHQQKWSWVTAIERMTETIRNPSMQDSQNLIRESLRMSSAVRQSAVNRKSIINQNPNEINSQLFKRLKLKLQSHVGDVQWLSKNYSKKAFKISRLEPISCRPQKTMVYGKQIEGNQMMEKIVQKIIEVQVEVPVERIIEKVVEVQKVVYVKDPNRIQHCSLIELFSSLISTNFDDPRPLLDFVAFLTLTGIEQFQKAAVDFACEERAQRFFAQLLLQALNEETSEDRLNSYSTLIYVLIERQPDYFYVSDMRVLIQILLRELQLYRSNLNQMINLKVMRALLSYHLNVLSQKREDIRAIIQQIANLGVAENQDIASQILLLIQ